MRRFVPFIALWLSLAPARAEIVDLPPTEVKVEPAESPETTTGTATVIELEDAVGRAESLAEVVAETPGVHLRRTGLPGSFSSLSIRGLGSMNVAVVLDDVPLTSATLMPIDLGAFPAVALERVEIYRGTGPVRFDTPLGGVIRLVSAPARGDLDVSAHVGYGAFATRSAHARLAAGAGDLRFSAFAGYEGTRGDFRYYDDADTPYLEADDRIRARENNAAEALFVRGAASHPGPLGGELRLSVSGLGREQGIPAEGYAAASRAHSAERQLVVRASLSDAELAGGSLRLTVGTDVLAATRAFRDPDHDTPLAMGDTDTTLARAAADARLQWLWSLTQETELVPRVSLDRFHQEGASLVTGGAEELARERFELGVGLEHRADFGSLRLVPSVRLQSVRDTGDDLDGSWESLAVSPRLGALYDAGACELRANAGRFHRVPTTLERYGDGVGVRPNLELRPERGLSADAGIGCAAEQGSLRLRGELSAFAMEATGLIAFVQVSAGALAAQNLNADRLAGTEVALAARWRWARGDLAYTLTRTEDVSDVAWLRGKRTVGIPEHRLQAALEVGPEEYGLRYELALASTAYLNPGNTRPIPRRLTHDVHARAALGAGFSLEVSVTNLTDSISEVVVVPGAPGGAAFTKVDYLGYPLPGRAWFAALLWRAP